MSIVFGVEVWPANGTKSLTTNTTRENKRQQTALRSLQETSTEFWSFRSCGYLVWSVFPLLPVAKFSCTRCRCQQIAAISPVSMATLAWTKFHTQIISWISGAFRFLYAWPLPEATSTTMRNFYLLWAACLCLLWSTFKIHDSRRLQASIHTRVHMQSHERVGLDLSGSPPNSCISSWGI